MPKRMTEVPRRMSQTYLSAYSGAKMKYSFCKNARVQIHKIGSFALFTSFEATLFNLMCALRCEGAWSDETCMHLALIQG